MTFEEVNKYEVWMQSTPMGKTRPVIVLRKFGEYATVAYVSPVGRESENSMTLTVNHEEMVTDIGKLGYAYYESLVEFVDRIPKDEQEQVEKKIASAFGVSVPAEKRIVVTDNWKVKYEVLKEMYTELLQRSLK